MNNRFRALKRTASAIIFGGMLLFGASAMTYAQGRYYDPYYGRQNRVQVRQERRIIRERWQWERNRQRYEQRMGRSGYNNYGYYNNPYYNGGYRNVPYYGRGRYNRGFDWHRRY